MTVRKDSLASACKDFEPDLVLYHYGELSEANRSHIQRHIDVCPGCAGYLRELGDLLAMTVKTDDPPGEFWDNYSREMRRRLASMGETKSWWQRTFPVFQPWSLPLLAAAAVVALALTFTLGKRSWTPKEIPTDDEAFMEVLPMTENLEFFTTMDVLDAMDLLENLGNGANESA